MKLRIGVVGIGPAWQTRHLPALRALSDRFEVRAICDPVRHRAEQAVRQLDATVCDGFQSLANRDDIDALLLLSARWYGPMPIYAACDAGKAIYCAAAIDLEDAEATQLQQRVKEAGIAFMAEFPCRLSPATLRLKELIATRLGAPRLLFCHRRRVAVESAEESPGTNHRGLRDLVELVDWCRYVVDQEPTSLQATAHNIPGGQQHDYFSVQLDFSPEKEVGTGPLAMIGCGDYVAENLKESLAYRRPADLKVVCDNGIAFIDLPNRLTWFDSAGQHMESLEHDRPVGEQLLLHFFRAVESLILKTSSLEDAHRAISIANRAKLSYEQGKRVGCLM